mgnify:FL=1
MKDPLKEIEQLEKSQATLNEILKVHLREPFDRPELEVLAKNHFLTLKKYNCQVFWDEKIMNKKKTKDYLAKCASEGYLVVQLPQLETRLLYLKVFGGKGFLGRKKIHYAVYQQFFDEKKWTPAGNFKIWAQVVTSINNIFRLEGLLKGSAI